MQVCHLCVLLILLRCYLPRGVEGLNTTGVDTKQIHESSNAQAVPASLRHIYVCVTFHWEVGALVFLRQALKTVQQYPTKTDIDVVTNQLQRLKLAMASWHSPATVHSPEGPLGHPYELAFAHRAFMEEALESLDPEYTAFMYIESDIRVPWRALLGWAEDDPILAQLGFQRAFYRVEPSEQTGRLGLTDQTARLDLPSYSRTLRTRVTTGDNTIHEKQFIQLPNPYMGMWIADRERMANFTASLQWTKRRDPWDVREMAACGLQLISPPEGFMSSAVVPYDPDSGQLDPDSAMDHLSNKYCGAHTREGMSLDPKDINNTMARHCTVSVEEFLVS